MIVELGKEQEPVFGGVIIEDRSTDFIAGGASGIAYEVTNPIGDWRKWKSNSEKQKKKTETSSCVTFSGDNTLEPQLNKMVAEGKFTDEAIKFFIDNGYLKNGQFNFTERFNAILSGTTQDGNSCQNVWDSFRKCEKGVGLLPEADCPFTDTMTTAQYFKNDITQAQREKAKKIWEYITIQYEWVIQNNVTSLMDWEVDKIREALKQAPLQLITPVCNWDETPTPCGNLNCQHATALYYADDNGFYIEDTYVPFAKMLSRDYIIRYVLKGVVTINDKYKKQNMKLIREKGRKETYAVINGKNYYIRNAETFNDLSAEKLADWNNVEEITAPIEIHGVIAG
jgi:hypothetical protein